MTLLGVKAILTSRLLGMRRADNASAPFDGTRFDSHAQGWDTLLRMGIGCSPIFVLSGTWRAISSRNSNYVRSIHDHVRGTPDPLVETKAKSREILSAGGREARKAYGTSGRTGSCMMGVTSATTDHIDTCNMSGPSSGTPHCNISAGKSTCSARKASRRRDMSFSASFQKNMSRVRGIEASLSPPNDAVVKERVPRHPGRGRSPAVNLRRATKSGTRQLAPHASRQRVLSQFSGLRLDILRTKKPAMRNSCSENLGRVGALPAFLRSIFCLLSRWRPPPIRAE